ALRFWFNDHKRHQDKGGAVNAEAVVTTVVAAATRDRAAEWMRRAGARLPTFAELSAPLTIPEARRAALALIDPDRPDPANLFRVHWYNDRSGANFAVVPDHLILPPELTGIRSQIVIVLGCRFPLIGAHKVLAAYGCLVPRLVT